MKCADAELHSLDDFLRHLKLFHKELKATSPHCCPVDSCHMRPYSSRKIFLRHFHAKHKKYIKSSSPQTDCSVGTSYNRQQVPPVEHIYTMEIDNIDTSSENLEVHPVTDNDRFTRMQEIVTTFCSLLNSHSSMPSVIVTSTLNHVCDLFRTANDVYKEKLSSLCQTYDSESSSHFLPGMEKVFGFVEMAFNQLKSGYRQIKYFESTGLYIPPETIKLGSTYKVKKKLNKYARAIHHESNVFISMRKVLQLFFSQPNVLNQYQNYLAKLEANNVCFENFVQGSAWLQVPKPQDGILLPLLLFNDEFECGNPLGSHAGVNKINGTYFSIACTPPEKRSLDTFFVTMLTKASYLKRYGNKVFSPLVKEFNFLSQEGIMVCCENSPPQKIYFQLGLLLGDHLGLNGILGFVENFSTSERCCRICRATRLQRASMVVEDPALLRTVKNYEQDIRKHDPKATGINKYCVFNQVKNYHIIEFPSVDVLHDLFLGIIKYDLLFLLNHYVNISKRFTLKQLNSRIANFDFGCDFSSKPPVFSAKSPSKIKIKLSGSECAIFIKYLGLLIGHWIPTNDPVWELYIALRRILDIITSSVLNKDIQSLLANAIEEHHSLYLELSGKNLTFKFHMLTHYPGLIAKIGPLRPLWTAPGERKHKSLKNIANSFSCRKNLSLSLGKRNQLQLSHKLRSKKFSEEKVSCGPRESPVKKGNFLKKLNEACVTPIPYWFSNSSASSVPWVESGGTRYCQGFTLNFAFDEGSGFPQFGRIEKIFISKSQKIYFCLQNFVTECFNIKLHAFRIKPLMSFSVVNITDLEDFHPHNAVSFGFREVYVTSLHNC
ncbi:unnamed protein product [Bemisia tabaci]|uniref:Uncharacterized protein n=1 Tax=Bemisia tabaci TaxID=7038 RepID=A0AAI8UUD1_BEMTA|nr:unnamed protein product [Bemisia tabaci]